jgi:hypothetical protein
MGGFGKEPVKGDGYSRMTALQILKKDRRFRGRDPQNAAAEDKKNDTDRWFDQGGHKEPITEEELFAAPENKEILEKVVKHSSGIKCPFFSRGYWSVSLIDYGRGSMDFSIQVQVGNRMQISASIIRQRIVSQLGEDAYERWKEMVMKDEDSLRVCLEAACEWLKANNRVGCSYVSSPSSLRLIERMGLRVEQGWCFLFPHYVGTF